jgi:hypothetical protein
MKRIQIDPLLRRTYGTLGFCFFIATFLLLPGCEEKKSSTAEDSTEKTSEQKIPEPWPPEVGKPYPSLRLLDTQGRSVTLGSFEGKVILLEPRNRSE